MYLHGRRKLFFIYWFCCGFSMFNLEGGFERCQNGCSLDSGMSSQARRRGLWCITSEVRHLCEPVVPARAALDAVLFDLRRESPGDIKIHFNDIHLTCATTIDPRSHKYVVTTANITKDNGSLYEGMTIWRQWLLYEAGALRTRCLGMCITGYEGRTGRELWDSSKRIEGCIQFG